MYMSPNTKDFGYFRYCNEESYIVIFRSIVELQTVSECDGIVSSLTKKLEKYFKDIQPVKGRKILGNLRYLPNGIIKSVASCSKVIATPWTCSASKTTEEKAKKVSKNYAKNTGKNNLMKQMLMSINCKPWGAQINAYLGKRVVRISNFAKLLKMAQAIELAPKELRNLIVGDFRLDLLAKELSHLEAIIKTPYLSDDLLKLVITMIDNTDSRTYWDTNKKLQNLASDLNKNNPFIKYTISYYKFNNEIEALRKATVNKYPEKYKNISHWCADCDLTDLEDSSIIRCAKEIYSDLYNIQDQGHRNMLIRIGVIEEGFLPTISDEVNKVIKDDIIDTDGEIVEEVSEFIEEMQEILQN